MSQGIMTIGSKGLVASVAFADAAGNPATPASTPQWTCSDNAIATLTPAADGMSCQISPAGKIGTATVSVTAEGDPVPGKDTITASGTVQVIAGEASSAALGFAAPPAAPAS